jgi:hypothetical protein
VQQSKGTLSRGFSHVPESIAGYHYNFITTLSLFVPLHRWGPQIVKNPATMRFITFSVCWGCPRSRAAALHIANNTHISMTTLSLIIPLYRWGPRRVKNTATMRFTLFFVCWGRAWSRGAKSAGAVPALLLRVRQHYISTTTLSLFGPLYRWGPRRVKNTVTMRFTLFFVRWGCAWSRGADAALALRVQPQLHNTISLQPCCR